MKLMLPKWIPLVLLATVLPAFPKKKLGVSAFATPSLRQGSTTSPTWTRSPSTQLHAVETNISNLDAEGVSSEEASPYSSSAWVSTIADETGNPAQQFLHRFLAAGGGDIGKRGEVYFFGQAIPIVGIAFGGLPLVSDALRAVTGPGLLILGFMVMAWTALDMGESLTPWPHPNGEGLVQTGLYGQVRHPMYAGLLASLTGFSIWTASIDRLLLVALLLFLLDVKSEYEERELAKVYPEYGEYKQKVVSKFFPQFLFNLRQQENQKEKCT
eukprot:scaffold336_cov196-Amphora_coffeaeformis.AAC.27